VWIWLPLLSFLLGIIRDVGSEDETTAPADKTDWSRILLLSLTGSTDV